jgi:hypothetical protein
MEEVVPLSVFANLARHRAHDREVIRAAGDVREEVRHLEAGLAVALGLPGAAEDVAVIVEHRLLHRYGHGLAVQAGEGGLGVEGVDVRDAARHVAEDDVLGLGLRRTFAGGINPERRRREESGQGDATEAEGATAEQFATGERVHVI